MAENTAGAKADKKTSGSTSTESSFDMDELRDLMQLVTEQGFTEFEFENENIRVVTRPKKMDSLEAYLGEEFIGVLFVENEKGRRSYIFELPILDVDLAGLTE